MNLTLLGMHAAVYARVRFVRFCSEKTADCEEHGTRL
jgi:hypothetical protein